MANYTCNQESQNTPWPGETMCINYTYTLKIIDPWNLEEYNLEDY